jgi:hypothetical protein
MPKSKHGRGKHPHYRKANKIRQSPSAGNAAQQPAGDMAMTAPSATAAATPKMPTPKIPTQKKGAAAAAVPLHYEFIPGDLRRIGVLAVIIVAILVILSFVLK